ncbi:disease resistance protein RUN1-like [Rosa chinensis]|uniref:disease resistance protein RUN1-like n=1 Tax=Rosa chinensis TaxID=74649 RepID=UPI001AD8AE2B|nr:disease resistance protein RUN1-like [Rosa chinensis]
MLDYDRALELFSLNAFKRNGPPGDYLKLAQRAVRYARGLPLALIVLGSHLYGRGRDEWETTLDNCQQVDRVKPILDACYDLKSVIGMKQLQEKALIRIDKDKTQVDGTESDKIWMHDLIEEMGKEIVRQQGEPGERSRLWNYDDVDHVLTNKTGTKKIKGIQVEEHEEEMICLNAKCFSEMKNLRYLFSYFAHYSGNIDYLSNELRWLNWSGCSIQSFPSNIHPRKRVALNISDNHFIIRLWEGLKNFPLLRSMHLEGCTSLRELPNFTGIPNLEELNLYGCASLVEVHWFVGSLDKLVTLNLECCSKLVKLPTEISLKSLRAMDLRYCTRLEEFPKIIGKMDSLRELNLSCTGVKELHLSIENLTELRELHLDDCKNLTTLPFNIYGLQNLEILNVSGCSKLVTFPEIMGKMDSLTELYLGGSGIKELHQSIGNLIGLNELNLVERKNLTIIPCSIYELQNLEILDVSGCSKLVTFPKIKGKMDSLTELYPVADRGRGERGLMRPLKFWGE